MGLDEEKCKFEERYDLLAGEKLSTKEQVASLDRSVECFSQQTESLVEGKKVLKGQVEEHHGKLEAKELMRKLVKDDTMWLLHKIGMYGCQRGRR